MSEFRVIIAGSCGFSDYDLLRQKCDAILQDKRHTHDIVIISGTARGADTLGEQYARERGLSLRKFPADWDERQYQQSRQQQNQGGAVNRTFTI